MGHILIIKSNYYVSIVYNILFLATYSVSVITDLLLCMAITVTLKVCRIELGMNHILQLGI